MVRERRLLAFAVSNVPQLASEACLHVLFPGLGEHEIDRLEAEIDRSVLEPCRTFLSNYNGALFFAYSLALYGLRFNDSREGEGAWQPFHMRIANCFELPPGISSSDLIFGSSRSDGSQLVLRADELDVAQVDRKSGRTINTWPSFEDCIVSELKRLGSASKF